MSLGSIWLIDDTEKQYCRMPREEGPRWSPPGEDWGGPDAGELQDLVWHDFIEWGFDKGRCRLIIRIDDKNNVVSAPLTRERLIDYLDLGN